MQNIERTLTPVSQGELGDPGAREYLPEYQDK